MARTNKPQDAANATRIVQCVNACAGIEDPVALPAAALAAIRLELHEMSEFYTTGRHVDIEKRAARMLALLGGAS